MAVFKVYVMANYVIANTIVNYIAEWHCIDEILVGGIRARDGGWHEYPARRKIVQKEILRTEYITPEKLENLKKDKYYEIEMIK